MSSYIFFLSYARADNDEYVHQFVRDLVAELRRQKPFDADQSIEFFDQPEIERGADWAAKLVDGLQSARILVPLYSPNYFASEYCGKEWRFFHSRCSLFGGKDRNKIFPALIKPVIWVPPATRGRGERRATVLPTTVHDHVRKLQYSRGAPGAPATVEGVRYLLKRLNDPKLQREYVDYVDSLSREIVSALDGAVAAPQVTPSPALGEVEAAFPVRPQDAGVVARERPAARVSAQGDEPRNQQSNKRIGFVVVAANAPEVPDSRDRSSYGANHREEWQPFLPKDTEQIAIIAQETASRLKLISEILEFNKATLWKQLNRAAKDGQVVILLIDGWTLTLGGDYAEALAKFDKGAYDNCGVLIPWNTSDTDLLSHSQIVEAALRGTLKRRMTVLNPVFLRMGITSRQEFEFELEDLITRLRAVLTNAQAPVRALPPSDIAKATIRAR